MLIKNFIFDQMLGTLQCSSTTAGAIDDSDEDGNADSVESIAFCPNKNMDFLAAGTVSGNVVLWDAGTLVSLI